MTNAFLLDDAPDGRRGGVVQNRPGAARSIDWTLRDASWADLDWLVELRAVVLEDDLTRLGRFDPVRVRQRLRGSFDPECTRIILVDGSAVGSVAIRPDDGVWWLEHLYIDPAVQGRGIGTDILRAVVDVDRSRTLRLNVLQGSPARRLYERLGFRVDDEDDVDVLMTRHP
ncbi:MAG: GNAT family N-acetyltransferase [Actinomycetota bacterium]